MAAENKTTFKNMLDCVLDPLIVRCHEPRAAVKHLSVRQINVLSNQSTSFSLFFADCLFVYATQDRTGDVISLRSFATCMPSTTDCGQKSNLLLTLSKQSILFRHHMSRSYCTCFSISQERVLGSRGTCHSGQAVINLRGRSIQAEMTNHPPMPPPP